MTGARRPTTKPRVHIPPAGEPPALPLAPTPQAPWWWSLVAGPAAGLLAVAIGLLVTWQDLKPDAFVMSMLFLGVALLAGVNVDILFGRVARVLAAAAEKGKEP